MEILLTAVYALTSLLMWPVVLTLLFAVGYSAYLVGEVCMEAYERRRPPLSLQQLSDIPKEMLVLHGVREWDVQRKLDPTAGADLVLDRTEAALARRIDRARTWVRLAPALGLAGTLIPLGPALVALAENDLAALSDRLILAFGTTVLGLLAGGFSWVVMNTQDRWYRLDLAELRHALERGE